MKIFRENDIDFLGVGSYAPQCSWQNKVELRMAMLSFLLAGVVLDHGVHGSHLDASKNTIDREVEKKNFAAAGTQAAELWHDREWSGHKIDAKYVHSPTYENLPVFNYPTVDQFWFAKHARCRTA